MSAKGSSGIATSALHDADVAIVGAGPVGTLLAILLGRQGKRVTLVERWTTAYDRPRAVTYDHEIARILATLGIDSENDPAIEFHDELYFWKNAAGEDIQIVDWQSQSASGWRVRYWFNQPDLEARLSRIVDTLPSVTQIRGFEAVDLEQDADGVDLRLRRNPIEDAQAQGHQLIRAKYVVGSDGAGSFVRETLKIPSHDKGYFFDWLILDMIPHNEMVISPAQWQLCDPSRPTTIVPGGPGRRRWEFMVLPHENAEEIAKEESAWTLLAPWGVTPESAVLERSAVYRFQARWAETWNVGRCVISGDAAHLMPPFAGEGMCAGLRDAFALGWRLNGILEGLYAPAVLDSYTSERKEHAKHYIHFSQELGKIICISDAEAAAERDRLMKADLSLRNNLPLPTDVCQLGAGAWCANTAHAGELSVQGVVESDGKRARFDQVVGTGWILIGLDQDPAVALNSAQLSQLRALGGRTVRVGTPGSSCDVADVEGRYHRWLSAIDASYVLLRPDFYVAATARTAADIRQRFNEVMASIHVRTETPLAA